MLGYHPHKPGRPSHTYHTDFVADLRLVLDVEVQAGNQSSPKHSAPSLWALLERLGRARWPAFIRGDRDWGTEANTARAEQEGLPYLFKQRLTKGTKRLVERLLRDANWSEAGQGWQGAEASLRLSGWSRARRVVVSSGTCASMSTPSWSPRSRRRSSPSPRSSTTGGASSYAWPSPTSIPRPSPAARACRRPRPARSRTDASVTPHQSSARRGRLGRSRAPWRSTTTGVSCSRPGRCRHQGSRSVPLSSRLCMRAVSRNTGPTGSTALFGLIHFQLAFPHPKYSAPALPFQGLATIPPPTRAAARAPST